MGKTVLKLENISKLYRLGEVGTGTISHDLNRWWHKVRGKEDPYQQIGTLNQRDQKGDSDYVWALKDINLEVKEGEILGIIGANGAGKSTLLKILSKVTAPTTGRIRGKGKISALLEVGTGFHPELTARENIYLNGAILGMRRHEITTQLDEIVDFAGVERYLDTPVKRFSSGMKVRLGFAVAAHLRTDILIVDEVLAVGDAEFQEKCIGKMENISKGKGKTVLFVSHNMSSVRKICNTGILLSKGFLKFKTTIEKTVEKYLTLDYESSKAEFNFPSKKEIGFSKLSFKDSNGKLTSEFYFGEPIEINLEINSSISIKNIVIVIGIEKPGNERIFTSVSNQLGVTYDIKKGKINIISAKFISLILNPGTYNVFLSIRNKTEVTIFDTILKAGSFTVTKHSYDDTPPFIGHFGLLRINPIWS